MDKLLKVAEVAARVGVLPSTIRYYAGIGLISASSTSRGGYRLFDESVVARVQEIRLLRQNERLTLEEIRQRLGR